MARNSNKVARRAQRKAKTREVADQKLAAQAQDAPLKIEWRTAMQETAWNTIENNDVTFLLGAVGSGKTFVAMAYAIHAILNKTARRIVLTRPIVTSGEQLGHLPGDLSEKVDPYMAPLYDTMDELLGKQSPRRELVNKSVVLAPLAYMRGRTFKDAICIFDEAQNATRMQLKMFLTRFGSGAKVIVNGDPEQSDLAFAPAPILDTIKRLQGVPNIATASFRKEDIVRHKTVQAIAERL